MTLQKHLYLITTHVSHYKILQGTSHYTVDTYYTLTCFICNTLNYNLLYSDTPHLPTDSTCALALTLTKALTGWTLLRTPYL